MGRKVLRRIEKALAGRLRKAKRVIFFLDYDGTLTPIRKRPALARADKDTKALLRRLASEPWARVFILSGRSLRDIKNLLGIKEIYYIGNHGIELKGPDLQYINKSANYLKPFIQKSFRALRKSLKIKGVIVENKLYTLSLHYRLADPRKIPFIKNICMNTVRGFVKTKRLKITEGKKVFEVRPNINWNKGTMADWVLKKLDSKRLLPICIGDDRTDEDAFRVLRKRGVSIVVSRKPRKTYAHHRVHSPKDVINLLKWILNLRGQVS